MFSSPSRKFHDTFFTQVKDNPSFLGRDDEGWTGIDARYWGNGGVAVGRNGAWWVPLVGTFVCWGSEWWSRRGESGEIIQGICLECSANGRDIR